MGESDSDLIFHLFGYFVDFAKAVVGDFALPTYPGQLIMLAVSMVFVALGSACTWMRVW